MSTDHGFVNDGILDPKKWNYTFPKILFLFKEATKRSGWTNIAGNPIDTSKGDNPRFWPNVLLWKHAIYGAFNNLQVPPYPVLKEKGTKEYLTNNGVLDEIAYVNFNKRLGESWSNNSTIAEIASENRDSLSSQINTIAPTVVYCCRSNFNAYQAIYPSAKVEMVARDIYIHDIDHTQRFVITFYHPSYWIISREHLYQKFSDILSQPAFIKRLTTPATSAG